MSADYKRYYVHHVMPRVNTMLLAVIGIGVLTLSLNYMRLVTGRVDVLLDDRFWMRVVLLSLVLAFAACNALSYYVYADRTDEPVSRVERPARVFALFLLDLAQVTFSACMFGVMYIDDPDGALRTCSESAADCLALPENGLAIIFALGALWHATVAIWYVTADSWRDRNVRTHAGLALLYLVFAPATLLDGLAVQWGSIAVFAAIVVLVYWLQGAAWLRGRNAASRRP